LKVKGDSHLSGKNAVTVTFQEKTLAFSLQTRYIYSSGFGKPKLCYRGERIAATDRGGLVSSDTHGGVA